MKKRKKTRAHKTKQAIITLAAILLVGLGTQEAARTVSNRDQQPANHPIITFNADRETYKVIEVLDGDTIRIDTGERVRYIGIDAPEKNMPLSTLAKKHNENLVKGKDVRLEFDREKTDSYGRILAYVFIGNTMVNETLLQEGDAMLYTPERYVPKYYDKLLKAEQWAKKHHNGMWLDEWRK